MTSFQFKKWLCSWLGHKPQYAIDTHKKKRLRNNVYKQSWDVRKITYCKRCGIEMKKEILHRNLTPEQYLKMFAYEDTV